MYEDIKSIQIQFYYIKTTGDEAAAIISVEFRAIHRQFTMPNKRDPGSCCLVYDFEPDWHSFVHDAASYYSSDVVAPNIQTCFANDVITFC